MKRETEIRALMKLYRQVYEDGEGPLAPLQSVPDAFDIYVTLNWVLEDGDGFIEDVLEHAGIKELE